MEQCLEMCLMGFNSPSCVRLDNIFLPFYKWVNKGSERLGNNAHQSCKSISFLLNPDFFLCRIWVQNDSLCNSVCAREHGNKWKQLMFYDWVVSEIHRIFFFKKFFIYKILILLSTKNWGTGTLILHGKGNPKCDKKIWWMLK